MGYKFFRYASHLLAILIVAGISSLQAQEFQTEIERAEMLGHAIFEQDQAAWVSTDAFLQDKKIQRRHKGKFRGYLSYRDGEAFRTIFVIEDAGIAKVAYETTTLMEEVIDATSLAEPRLLTIEEAERWSVRQTLLSQNVESCKGWQPMNTIVLPTPEAGDDAYLGYLFSATTRANEIVLGKHYRFEISADATIISEPYSFTQSCFAIRKPKLPKGQKIVGLVATHINAPHPEETHIFANLVHKTNLIIVTVSNERIWRVEEGMVSEIER